MSRRSCVAFAVTTWMCIAETASAGDNVQQWTVVFQKDAIAISASSDVKHRHILATTSALSDVGYHSYTIQITSADKQSTPKDLRWLQVRVRDDVATIIASRELECRCLIRLIERLKATGVKRVQFSAP